MRGARGSTGGGEGAVRGFWEGAREEQASRCACVCVCSQKATGGSGAREGQKGG